IEAVVLLSPPGTGTSFPSAPNVKRPVSAGTSIRPPTPVIQGTQPVCPLLLPPTSGEFPSFFTLKRPSKEAPTHPPPPSPPVGTASPPGLRASLPSASSVKRP